MEIDRCALACELHQQKKNCAQSVAGAFADLTGLPAEQIINMATGFGSGVGGSREELCGSISGGILVLGLLYPGDKPRCYRLGHEFRRRFEEIFGTTRCRELLAARPGVSGRTPAAKRLNVTSHCRIMVVTAVELLEAILQEEANHSD